MLSSSCYIHLYPICPFPIGNNIFSQIYKNCIIIFTGDKYIIRCLIQFQQNSFFAIYSAQFRMEIRHIGIRPHKINSVVKFHVHSSTLYLTAFPFELNTRLEITS